MGSPYTKIMIEILGKKAELESCRIKILSVHIPRSMYGDLIRELDVDEHLKTLDGMRVHIDFEGDKLYFGVQP